MVLREMVTCVIRTSLIKCLHYIQLVYDTRRDHSSIRKHYTRSFFIDKPFS